MCRAFGVHFFGPPCSRLYESLVEQATPQCGVDVSSTIVGGKRERRAQSWRRRDRRHLRQSAEEEEDVFVAGTGHCGKHEHYS